MEHGREDRPAWLAEELDGVPVLKKHRLLLKIYGSVMLCCIVFFFK